MEASPAGYATGFVAVFEDVSESSGRLFCMFIMAAPPQELLNQNSTYNFVEFYLELPSRAFAKGSGNNSFNPLEDFFPRLLWGSEASCAYV